MEATLKIWAMIVIVGALNFASRLSFIAFFSRREMPALLASALKFVPAAMLTALIVPMIVQPGGPSGGEALPRVVAALIAAAVAWRVRSPLGAIVAGMVALWTGKAIMGV
ncbi:MAG TPA: AzlD domain-containing protein [Casimicrobiaceae bacterium]|jgi:branched-subunit amino acid transport protein